MPTWLNIVIIIISLWSLYLSLTKKRRARKAEGEGEDFVSRTSDRVGKRMMENDPELRRLKLKLKKSEKEMYKMLVDQYKSPYLIGSATAKQFFSERQYKTWLAEKARKKKLADAELAPLEQQRKSESKGRIDEKLRLNFEAGILSLEDLKKKQAKIDIAKNKERKEKAEKRKQQKQNQDAIYDAVQEQWGADHLKDCIHHWNKTTGGISDRSNPAQWIERAERLKELLEHPANRESFDAWEVRISATHEMVKHILGNPKDKNIKQLKNKRREYWYYKGRKTNQGGTVYSYRVRLEDGVVTEFGDGKFRP